MAEHPQTRLERLLGCLWLGHIVIGACASIVAFWTASALDWAFYATGLGAAGGVIFGIIACFVVASVSESHRFRTIVLELLAFGIVTFLFQYRLAIGVTHF
jgi:hypothetical protein